MVDALAAKLSPLLAGARLELVDLELRAGLVRVTVDREGGVDFEGLTEANRIVSHVLDELDPFPGRYMLEVSSPGLERPLRRPCDFIRSIGSIVSLRLPGADGEARRVKGNIVAADADGFVLQGAEVPGRSMRLHYEEVERARTVFDPSSMRGSAKRSRRASKRKGRGARRSHEQEKVTT